VAETILVIDDQRDVVTALEHALTEEGYDVLAARDGEAGLARALEAAPDVVLLDVKMPGMDGYQVCRALRDRGFGAPILMLTAKDSEDQKVRGLDAGADDYVTKPFGLKELAARIRAVLRRPAAGPSKVHEISFGETRVDFDRQEVIRAGKVVPLSSFESELLRLLVARRGEVVSREAILKDVWGYEVPPETRTVDYHVVRLRQKLEDDPRHPRHVLTAHGRGYKFAP